MALPLCLGVALASNAPLFSGILAGIIGGIIVGSISGSSVSVSGPAAGLTAVVAVQIQQLGSFEAFLVAVFLAGIIQLILGICKLGFVAAFFPTSVIKGLLWAIGIILVLKQIPHLVGHDVDPIGGNSFIQADHQNTFSELLVSIFDMHPSAVLIGFLSILILVLWDKFKVLKDSKIPSPVIVIVLSIVINLFLQKMGAFWSLTPAHLVQVPVANSIKGSLDFLIMPDFNILSNPTLFTAAITIALVASLETLLNVEALEKLDPLKRSSHPNRELIAQGCGNMIGGLIGAIPMTSVIVRSSVNINAGASSKISTVFHGLLILFSVVFIPNWLNLIPLSALAAILLVTGLKLASPETLKQMWKEGKYQFLPFIVTVLAIVFTDLLMGVIIGLAVAICFILHSNIRRPIKKVMEKHANGTEVLHIELPNQVSFFNKASLENTLKSVPSGGHVLINASGTDYIDPDILDLINDFKKDKNDKKIVLSLAGFQDKYSQLEDQIQYIDFTSREMQEGLDPKRVLETLKEGNLRFRNEVHLTRSLTRQLNIASTGQYPMAVVLSCIDSRSPVELIFDLSIGDIFSVRLAGNVISRKVLGSIEYSCAVAGAKVILVMGHTSCGAIKATVDLICNNTTALEATGCANLDWLVDEIQKCINKDECKDYNQWPIEQKQKYLDRLAFKNVCRTIHKIRQNSSTIEKLLISGKIAIVGAMYDVSKGDVKFFEINELEPFEENDHQSSLLNFFKTPMKKLSTFLKNRKSN